MFPFKKKRPRRSELRLGKRATNYQLTALAPRLVVTPVIHSVQQHKIRLSGGFLLIGLLTLFYMLFSNPIFFVYGADIQGNAAVSAKEIYLVSNLHNQSIFWLDAESISANITALPNVKSAEVTVHLPAQVSIFVEERNPELLWETGQDSWWVDSEGVVVPPRGDTEGMLRIIDNDQQPLEVGYKIDPTIIRGAQMLQNLVPGLSAIQHSRAKGLTVATPQGWPVYLGDGSEIQRKLSSLTAVVTQIKTESLTPLYIDLRNPLRPVYREKPLIPIEQPMFAPRFDPNRF
ncbi:FtsQ-type POTRA domain-containing protein [Anaerolineales bacterium HSG25]|nr:FtsQ-type POTRA domain-containing protein [Anaerolineales bacterium HSG25]